MTIEQSVQSIEDMLHNAHTVKGDAFGAMLVHELHTSQIMRILPMLFSVKSSSELESHLDSIAELLTHQSAHIAGVLDIKESEAKEMFPLVDAMMAKIEQAEQKL